MGKQPAKKNRALLWRWVIALGTGTLLLAMLAAAVNRLPPPEPQIPPNPYGPEDFVYENGRMECLSGEAIHGIDVSYYQGDIDWQAVRASGVEFAIIRVGYRSYDDGTVSPDVKALQNLAGARAAGLKLGAYFFSQALNEAEALEEAEFALSMVEGYDLELPLVFDWEYVSESARTGTMEPQALMACARAFCGAVEAEGRQPMVYFNRDLAKNMLELEDLTQYPWWLAMYDWEAHFPYRVDFWQYTDEGRVPGIEGDVDLDLYFPGGR